VIISTGSGGDGTDFVSWYPRDGRPGLCPAQLATVCVLQFLLNLSDRQAAEAVRCRTDFTYAPALELDDPGFHHSVLTDFRERLCEGDRTDQLLSLSLERMERMREAGMVTERGKQRTDPHPGSGRRAGPHPPGAGPPSSTGGAGGSHPAGT
jgi:Transposase domain (DUF772)